MSALAILGAIFVVIALVIIFYWIHCHLSSWGVLKSGSCSYKGGSKGGSCGSGSRFVVQQLQGEDCEDRQQIGRTEAIHVQGGSGTLLLAIDDPSRVIFVKPVSVCDGEGQEYHHDQQLQM